MFFRKKETVTEFVPTFLKEDRRALRKIHEMVSNAQSHIYIIYPWITLGEEFVIPFENALSYNEDIEVYLITKLEKEDAFKRLHQLDDVEKWKSIFDDKISIKYNNNIHAKMIIVDDREMLAGSSNLTGSGLGSSRDYEGKPQIEANIYTDDSNAVENAIEFFVKLWNHNTSKEYMDNEYVLSCKSHHLSGIFQRYRKDFNSIVKQEEISISNDGKLRFRGILGYFDSEKEYILGKKRKDIAVKLVGNHENLKGSKIGDMVEVSGKIGKMDGICEFSLINYPKKNSGQYTKIYDLKIGLSRIKVKGTVINVENPIELETQDGKKILTLIKIKDDTGDVILELWNNKVIRERIKCGMDIEIINGYTKAHDRKLRVGLQKQNGKINLGKY